jgi:hypothetical protein
MLIMEKNLSNEAMKRLTLAKNWSDEAFNASSPLLPSFAYNKEDLPQRMAR